MNLFYLCTATQEKDYFFVPDSIPALSKYNSQGNPELEKADMIWRAAESGLLNYALVSCNGVATFSAGPLTSGRQDRYGRPIANYVVVKSDIPENKIRMGKVFSAMLADCKMQKLFSQQFETQVVQAVLNGGTWNGNLPDIENTAESAGLPEISQQEHPVNSPAKQQFARKIINLINSDLNFAIGTSAYSGQTIAQKLQDTYNFDWPNTFIAIFSTAVQSTASLPSPERKKTAPSIPVRKILKTSVIIFLAGISFLAIKACTDRSFPKNDLPSLPDKQIKK